MKDIFDFLWYTPIESLFLGLMGIVFVIAAALIIMVLIGILALLLESLIHLTIFGIKKAYVKFWVKEP